MADAHHTESGASPALFAFFRSLAPLSEVELGTLVKGTRELRVKTGETLLRVGERPRDAYFVVEGLLRQYYITREGKEFNKRFCFANELAGSYAAFLAGTESRVAIQALEDSRLVVTDFENLVRFFESGKNAERIGRKVAEALYLEKAEREYEFLIMSPEERYDLLLARHPRIEERLTQYHIASYLGITPVALSRIRKRKIARS